MSPKSIKEILQLPTIEAARHLLGVELSTTIRGKTCSGIIVETEAYHGELDEASHSFRGKTPRNSVMFAEPGHCYVYFIYGMYHCVNVVTEDAQTGAAVLIRALEPKDGLRLMEQRRRTKHKKNFTSGPGKLCAALGIDKSFNSEHFLASPKIKLAMHTAFPDYMVGCSQRIGISKSQELEWRFFVKDNQFVSKYSFPSP